jgi:hypothetical protein
MKLIRSFLDAPFYPRVNVLCLLLEAIKDNLPISSNQEFDLDERIFADEETIPAQDTTVLWSIVMKTYVHKDLVSLLEGYNVFCGSADMFRERMIIDNAGVSIAHLCRTKVSLESLYEAVGHHNFWIFHTRVRNSKGELPIDSLLREGEQDAADFIMSKISNSQAEISITTNDTAINHNTIRGGHKLQSKLTIVNLAAAAMNYSLMIHSRIVNDIVSNKCHRRSPVGIWIL